jgi:hypothetical protein
VPSQYRRNTDPHAKERLLILIVSAVALACAIGLLLGGLRWLGAAVLLAVFLFSRVAFLVLLLVGAGAALFIHFD